MRKDPSLSGFLKLKKKRVLLFAEKNLING